MRGTLRCDGGINGQTLAIDGLDTTVTDVLVRIHHADGRLESHLLKPMTPSVTLGAQTTGWQRASSYLRLGVEHILLGVDHLLFVLGLLLIVDGRWTLVKTITSFTLAHSITLAIATLGYASAPLPPLNAAIALSILFLGPEIVRRWRGADEPHDPAPLGRGLRLRPAARLRLRQRADDDGPAEGGNAAGAAAVQRRAWRSGQLVFVALIVLLERAFRTLEIRWPRLVEALPGYAVGSLGAYWTIQRTLVLLGGLR